MVLVFICNAQNGSLTKYNIIHKKEQASNTNKLLLGVRRLTISFSFWNDSKQTNKQKWVETNSETKSKTKYGCYQYADSLKVSAKCWEHCSVWQIKILLPFPFASYVTRLSSNWAPLNSLVVQVKRSVFFVYLFAGSC